MTVIFGSKLGIRKKYMVGGQGRQHAYADTLAEAKLAGEQVAKREAWRGSWNVLFITVPILKADAPESTRYISTGWRMYVPVRGSGALARHIVSEIKRRHGVAPMVWTQK